MIIASPALSFCARSNPAIPSPQSQRQIVSFWGGGGRGTTLRPHHQKPTICQLLIVVCLSSVNSDETPMPPLQELPHCDRNAGGGRIATPPPPRVTTAPACYPAPWRGSSFSSPLCCSCCAEPRWSATWPMINAAGCGAKSSLSGGTVVPVQGRARRCRPGPGGPPCGGVAKGVAPSSGVGGGDGDAGFGAWPLPPLCRRNMPASPPAGRQGSRTRTCAGRRHG
jgi:hypothetical protein